MSWNIRKTHVEIGVYGGKDVLGYDKQQNNPNTRFQGQEYSLLKAGKKAATVLMILINIS